MKIREVLYVAESQSFISSRNIYYIEIHDFYANEIRALIQYTTTGNESAWQGFSGKRPSPVKILFKRRTW